MIDVAARLKFIEIFEAHPAVWDKSTPEFRAYQKRAPFRNETWVSIAKAFSDAGVKIKVDCLRQAWIHARTPFLHFMNHRLQKSDNADYELHFHEKLIALGSLFVVGMQLPQEAAEIPCQPTGNYGDSAENPEVRAAEESNVADLAETIPPVLPVATVEVKPGPIPVTQPPFIRQDEQAEPTTSVIVDELSPDDGIPPPLPMHRSYTSTTEFTALPDTNPPPIVTMAYVQPAAGPKEPKIEFDEEEVNFVLPAASFLEPMEDYPPPPVARDFMNKSIPAIPMADQHRKRKLEEHMEDSSDVSKTKKSAEVQTETVPRPAPNRSSPTNAELRELHITFCPESSGQWNRTATIVRDFESFTHMADGSFAGAASQYDPVADDSMTLSPKPLPSIQLAVPSSAQLPPVPRHRSSHPQRVVPGVPLPSNFMPPSGFYNPYSLMAASMQMNGTVYDPVHQTFYQQTQFPTGTIYDSVAATQTPSIPPHSHARKL